MRTSARQLVTAFSFGLSLTFGPVAWAASDLWMNVTDVEIVMLPKFCWAQMGSKVATGPAFQIPRSCGPGMNHYCPGLVMLLRAKNDFGKKMYDVLLARAGTDVEYTLNAMKEYPECPIRKHVEATKEEIAQLRSRSAR
jgi:hypothetical protein